MKRAIIKIAHKQADFLFLIQNFSLSRNMSQREREKWLHLHFYFFIWIWIILGYNFFLDHFLYLHILSLSSLSLLKIFTFILLAFFLRDNAEIIFINMIFFFSMNDFFTILYKFHVHVTFAINHKVAYCVCWSVCLFVWFFFHE